MFDRQSIASLFAVTAGPAALSFVAIWAGVSHRHWFARAGAICACWWLLVAIRAFDPAMVFVIAMPAIALATWAIEVFCRNRNSSGNVAGARSRAGRFRYGLKDLLLLMTLFGLGTPLVALLLRNDLEDDGMILLRALGWTVVSVLSAAVVIVPGWWKPPVISALLIAVPLHIMFRNKHGFGEHFLPEEPWTADVMAFIVQAALIPLLVSLHQIAVDQSNSTGAARSLQKRYASVGFWLITLTTLILPLGVVYALMLRQPRRPEEETASTNVLPSLLARTQKVVSLNKSELTLDEFERASGRRARKQLEALYVELMAAAEQPGHFTIDWGRNADFYFMADVPTLQSTRQLGRNWEAESQALAHSKRFDAASDYSLANIRVGNTLSHGGLVTHSLCGIVLEGVGTESFRHILGKVSIAKARSTLTALQTVDRSREPIELTLARDDFWIDRAFDWIARLQSAEWAFAGEPYNESEHSSLQLAARRRDANLRLLTLELAIRLFRHDHGRLPKTIHEVVPQYLQVIPADPFSMRPLIYRRSGKSYLVYSTGPDGQDNGGRFGTLRQTLFKPKPGFDFDLNTNSRPEPSASKSVTSSHAQGAGSR